MTHPEDCPYDQAMAERRAAENTDHSIRIALLEQSMKNITSKLHGINQNISRLIWIAVTAIGASAVQFIIGGGLK